MSIGKPKRITNRQITAYVEACAPFRANSTTGEWLHEPGGTGILPDEWVGEYRAAFGSDTRPVAVYVVRSYDTPIAWFTGRFGWTVPAVRYSHTTSRVQTYVRAGAAPFIDSLYGASL